MHDITSYHNDNTDIYRAVLKKVPLYMDGFRFVTVTTVVAGNGCKESQLNLSRLVIHSFHRLIASSQPLTNLELVLVIDSYHKLISVVCWLPCIPFIG